MDNTLFLTFRPLDVYALFLFVFVPGSHHALDLFALMKRKVRNGDSFSVKKLLRALAARGLLRQASPNSGEYLLKATLTREQLADLVRQADAGGWWPSQEDLDACAAEQASGGRYRFYRSRGESDFEYARMLLLRLFACDTALPSSVSRSALARVLAGTKRAEVAEAVAEWTRTVMPEGPDFAARSWSADVEAVMPAWLTAAFLAGDDCGAALSFVEQNLTRVTEPNEDLHRVYAALRIWRGEGDTLSDVPTLRSYATIYEPLFYVAAGKYAVADKKNLWYSVANSSNAARDSSQVQAASLFLSAFVAAAAKPEKVPRTRPVSIFREMLGGGESYAFSTAPEEVFRQRVKALAHSCANGWKGALDGKGLEIRHADRVGSLTPVQALMMALDYRYLPFGRASYGKQAEAVALSAKRFADAGYQLVAATLLALLKGGYREEDYAALRTRLFERVKPLFPMAEVAPEWKNALALLEKSLPKKSGTEERNASSAHIVWYVSLDRLTEDCYDVDEIYPAIRPADAPEDGRGDDVFDWYDFDVARHRKLMTDKDYLLAKTLEASDGEVTDEAVECLCELTNLVRADDFDPYERRRRSAYPETFAPLTVLCGACRLETAVTDDGGLALRVPPWLADNADRVFLHALGGERFECLSPSRDALKLIEAFRGFGAERRLVLPAEALRASETLVARLQEVMPFAERDGGDTASLKRVVADARVVVRLVYAEGVLDMRAAVRPIADNTAMTFEPAVGASERLVTGVAGSYVLVRDLAQEKANLEAVKAVLAGHESFFDGRAAWHFDELASALAALSALKASNPPIEMEWPDERRLRISYAPKSGVALTSQRTAEDWFRVDGTFTLDDGRVLGIVQLLEAAKSREGNFVRLSDGDFVALTQTMARELDALNAAGRRKGESIEIVKAAVPMLDGVFGESSESLTLPDALAKTAEEIRTALGERIAIPRNLSAELRPYQKEGYRWLSRLARCGFGSCLADDMGLGKTLQVMTLFLERAKDGPSLVLAPSSVCGNWRSEIRRFAPTLTPILAQETADWTDAAASTVVIASYGYLLFHLDEFAAVAWNGLVLDEAQAIKNDASKRAKAVKRLKARFRVAATGTPVENRLGELWSLMDFLNPGLLGTASGFTTRFTADGKASPALKRLVKPLILRRLKGDVLDDLPTKTEVTLPITLGTAERTAYEGCRQHALQVLAEKGEGEEGPNRMSILAELTRLRRFCCHPSLVLPNEALPSAKLEALLELLANLRDGHHRALVFSQFTDYLALVRKAIDARGWTHLYLDGSTPTVERGRLVESFQSGEGDFFLISLKAGGTGLNLTAADYVILLDPWWNPAVENQAADRAHRIGQQRPVTIYRLIASDTVEERVIELHREKQAIAEDVLEGTGSAALTPAQLMHLFG